MRPDSPYSVPDVVDVYDRVSAPTQFVAPAKDLVSALHLRSGEWVLDVGTGTGAAARVAATAVGPDGKVVGIDPSLLMLGRAWLKDTVCVAAARAPALPFRERCFDAITANFVLSHLDDAAEGVAHMVKLLRPGGRLGVSSWGAGVTLPSELWNDIVAVFTNAEELKRAFRLVIPGDVWCSDPANLQAVLRASGLRPIDLLRRQYAVTLSVADYLAMKQSSVEGVLLRRRLSSLDWAIFTRQLAEQFQSRFGDFVPFLREAHIAIGTHGAR